MLRAEIYPDSDDSNSGTGFQPVLSNGSDNAYDRIEYTYNRQGQRLSLKDQNGSVHDHEYDDLGRQLHDRITTLASGVDGAVRRLSATYEVRGQIEKSTSYDNATVGSGNVVNEVLREYNDFGLLDKEYQEHDGAKDGNTPYVGYNYDETATSGELENGVRPTSHRYPNGRLVHYTYGSTDSATDILNRLDATNDDSSGSPGDAIASYTYLGLGTVVIQDYEEPDVKLDHFGGTSGTYAGFDRFDRIVDHRWYDYGSSADVDRYKYGYDRASNRIWKENVVAADNSKDFDEFYTYDGLHRLQNFDRGDLNAGKTAITGTPGNEEDWTLDPLGNWESFVQKTSGITDLNQSRTVNDVNEITNITETTGPSWITPAYDRNGNMTTVPKPADPTVGFTCTYDAWNRTVKVEEGASTVGEYAYDALKRRITKDVDSTVRHFLYSRRWQALEERLDGSSDPERQQIWGPRFVDQLLLRDRDTSEPTNGTLDERLYSLQDANWNVTAVVDTTGNAGDRYLYDPYGESEEMDGSFNSTSSNSDTLYTFTGRNRDLETGIYDYRNRHYAYNLGKFVGRDPIGYAGRAWSLYEYVEGGPLDRVDPSGLVVCELLEAIAWTKIADIYNKKGDPRCNWPIFVFPNSGSMPRQHCLWNCRMTKLLGEDFARKCSLEKEGKDWQICDVANRIPNACWSELSTGLRFILSGHCCSAMQPADFEDNATGRLCGKTKPCFPLSVGWCGRCCTKFGLPPGAPERGYGPRCAKRYRDTLDFVDEVKEVIIEDIKHILM